MASVGSMFMLIFLPTQTGGGRVTEGGGAIPECGLQRAASGKSLRVSTPGERPGELCRRALLSATCCPL